MAKRVRFIQNAQSVGFGLQNIKDILQIGGRGELACCDSVRELLHTKIDEIQIQMNQLKDMKMYLQRIEKIWGKQQNAIDNGLCHLLLALEKP